MSRIFQIPMRPKQQRRRIYGDYNHIHIPYSSILMPCFFTQPRSGSTLVFFEGNDGNIHYNMDDLPSARSNTAKPTAAGSTEGSQALATGETGPSSKCLNGTQLSVVGNSDGSKLVLFYQDSEGYLCYR